ncbi:MAG: class I SAM-dependent methyltransferase [Oscillospiraceae bacterium]|jgi:ubiquinone/menaquinone biosynthesis C-methylase UbiE|nr:class I SAM-dependent methyltransferase [Oscillospiraceae bacterium]
MERGNVDIEDVKKEMPSKWSCLHSQERFRPKYPDSGVVKYVFRNFNTNKHEKVLDVGCGAGRHLRFLAREGFDAYGIDFSESGIGHAKKQLECEGLNAVCQVATVDKIPYDDNYFDGCLAIGSIYYCTADAIKKAADEIFRVLKPGGKALVVVRSTEDYRFKGGREVEHHTIIGEETDKSKCAASEHGMSLYFFDRKELEELFNKFSKITIDRVIATHENEQYEDNDFFVSLEK